MGLRPAAQAEGDQWATIRRLDAKLDRIIGHLRTLQDEGDAAAPPASAPPPHY